MFSRSSDKKMSAENIDEQIAKLDATIAAIKKHMALLQSRIKDNSEIASVLSKIRNLAAQIEDFPPPPERGQFDDRESFDDAYRTYLRLISSEYAEQLTNTQADETRIESLEALKFPLPPNINDYDSIDGYVEALGEWAASIKEDLRQQSTDSRIPLYEPLKKNQAVVRVHGAFHFANQLLARVRVISKPYHKLHRARQLILIERELERWRRSALAAQGKKGRRQSWHAFYIESAVTSGYHTFDEVLDYLDDLNHGCVFRIDKENEIIYCLPDAFHEDDEYPVSFAAAKKSLTRANEKLK